MTSGGRLRREGVSFGYESYCSQGKFARVLNVPLATDAWGINSTLVRLAAENRQQRRLVIGSLNR